LSIPSWAFAQPPEISIELSLDCTSCSYGEPVGASVVVTNGSGSDIYINEGFMDTVFYQRMRIIDPAGQLLGVILVEPPEEEVPDAPPVPVVFRNGRHIRVIPHEVMGSSWQTTSATDNLLGHYPLQLPGWYSVQVQVSAMTFTAGDPGNIHNYEWQGVLKSNTVYFYVEGSTRVNVVPNEWHLEWFTQKGKPEVKVKIWPAEGKTVEDYQAESIRLNNVPARRVKVVAPKIEAYFDAREAIGSLGEVELGQWYPVVLSGRLTSDQPFGGGTKVKVVR